MPQIVTWLAGIPSWAYTVIILAGSAVGLIEWQGDIVHASKTRKNKKTR